MRRGTDRRLWLTCILVTLMLLWSVTNRGLPLLAYSHGPRLMMVSVTTPGSEQEQRLTQLSQMLQLVPNIQWLVVENAEKSSKVTDILERSQLAYTHLWKEGASPVTQINHVFHWLRELGSESYVSQDELDPRGILVFLAEDCVYDVRLFPQIRKTQSVVAWPIGNRDNLMEVNNSPWDGKGKVIPDWYPTEFKGFGLKLRLLFRRPYPSFKEDMDEAEAIRGFLLSLRIHTSNVEIVTSQTEQGHGDHTDILVWKT